VDIVVKGRHCEVPERFRQHAVEKLGKVARLDPKVIRLDVELSKERNPRLADRSVRIELTCRTRGPVVRAEASADDTYAALDLACGRLEQRLRRTADRRRVHHGSRTPVSLAAATARMPDESDVGARGDEDADALAAGASADGADGSGPVHVEGEGPLVVREKTHAAEPMTLEQALYEMELVGHDFYLFVDRDSAQPSVVYRRRGYDYGVIRLTV